LVDARVDEFGVDGIAALLLQLQDIQQLIFHIGEMFANDGGCLFVADDLSQVEIVHERQGHPLPYRESAQGQETPQQTGSNARAEVEIVLRHVEQDEQAEHHAHGVEGAAQELIDVELADETVKLFDEQGVVIALHNLLYRATWRKFKTFGKFGASLKECRSNPKVV
jgi:hypothetical protein